MPRRRSPLIPAPRALGRAPDAAIASAKLLPIATEPSPTSAWIWLPKTADQSVTSSTTFATDDALQVKVEAGTRYRFQGDVRFSTPVAAGIKLQLIGPAGLTRCSVTRHGIAGGATTLSGIAVDKALETAVDLVGTGQDGWFAFDAILEVGATAGLFAVQWAQSVLSIGTTTVQRGSSLAWRTY